MKELQRRIKAVEREIKARNGILEGLVNALLLPGEDVEKEG